MIEYVSGSLVEKKPGHVIVESQGMGYRIHIPLSTYEKLPRQGPVKIFTWLKVSEDALRLFGFATTAERDFFLRLVEGVGQLGPAKALSILSSASLEQLTRAIEEGDVKFLKGIKGIGEKIASRLVLELRGQLPAWKSGAEASISRDAVQALQSLGYDRAEAEAAVRKTVGELPAGAPLEELVKRSLANV